MMHSSMYYNTNSNKENMAHMVVDDEDYHHGWKGRYYGELKVSQSKTKILRDSYADVRQSKRTSDNQNYSYKTHN